MDSPLTHWDVKSERVNTPHHHKEVFEGWRPRKKSFRTNPSAIPEGSFFSNPLLSPPGAAISLILMQLNVETSDALVDRQDANAQASRDRPPAS